MADSPVLLSSDVLKQELTSLSGWHLSEDTCHIAREFSFSNFHETMAFVNALAWIAHDMDHHPDFQVGYKTCSVMYTTHSHGGVTNLDLDAARRVNDLFSS
jgi:4a-hydroxytetrahydrobiopterin dehydratase